MYADDWKNEQVFQESMMDREGEIDQSVQSSKNMEKMEWLVESMTKPWTTILHHNENQ